MFGILLYVYIYRPNEVVDIIKNMKQKIISRKIKFKMELQRLEQINKSGGIKGENEDDDDLTNVVTKYFAKESCLGSMTVGFI